MGGTMFAFDAASPQQEHATGTSRSAIVATIWIELPNALSRLTRQPRHHIEATSDRDICPRLFLAWALLFARKEAKTEFSVLGKKTGCKSPPRPTVPKQIA